MHAHAANADVQQIGCRTLNVFVKDGNGDLRQGVVEAVLTAMQAHAEDAILQTFGCVAHYSIAEFHAPVVGDAGSVQAVVSALRAHALNVDVQRAGCEALCFICRWNEELQTRAREATRLGRSVREARLWPFPKSFFQSYYFLSPKV